MGEKQESVLSFEVLHKFHIYANIYLEGKENPSALALWKKLL